MANIRGIISTYFRHGLTKVAAPLPTLREDLGDRLYHDLIGLSDSDAMWYYERRKWRGRD